MIFHLLHIDFCKTVAACRSWLRPFAGCLLALLIILGSGLWVGTPAAQAGINDDRFDGNIYALYGGNGSLVPPKVKLADSLKQGKPALLVFFVDDSSDCKQFAPVVSGLQSFYGRSTDFLPLNVDALPVKSTYDKTEPGYYYHGVVPETVLIDQSGKVVLDAKGQVAFEKVDDAFREVFDLVPRAKSVELMKRRSFNEYSSEVSK